MQDPGQWVLFKDGSATPTSANVAVTSLEGNRSNTSVVVKVNVVVVAESCTYFVLLLPKTGESVEL